MANISIVEVVRLCDKCSSKGQRIGFDYPFKNEKIRVAMAGFCFECGRDFFGKKFGKYEGLFNQILAVSPNGRLNVDWHAYAQALGRNNGRTELETNEILVYLGKLTVEKKGSWWFSNPEMNPPAFSYMTKAGFVVAVDATEYATAMKRTDWSLVHIDNVITSKEVLRQR